MYKEEAGNQGSAAIMWSVFLSTGVFEHCDT